MTVIGWFEIALVLAAVVLCAWPLGTYIASVFQGRITLLSPVLGWVERGIYRAAGIKAEKEQGWLTYTLAMLVFDGAGFIFLYGLMRLQGVLPLNPQGFSGVAPDLAFNTAMSFVTNTNWQAYGGETTMSLLVWMAGFCLLATPAGFSLTVRS